MVVIFTFSLWVQTVIVIGGTLLLVTTSRLLARRMPAGPALDRAQAAATALRQPTTTIVALILALCGMQVISEFHQAEAEAIKEASMLEHLYRDAHAYGGVQSEAFCAAVVVYTKSVIDEEWPVMRELQRHRPTQQRFDVLFGIAREMRAADSREQTWLNEIVRGVNITAELRRARLADAEGHMPWPFYAVVVSGLTVILCLAGLLPPGIHSTAIMYGHAMVLGLTLLLVVSLDMPFSGTLGVTPEPFSTMLDNVRAIDGAQPLAAAQQPAAP
jgi:hypothetical protein